MRGKPKPKKKSNKMELTLNMGGQSIKVEVGGSDTTTAPAKKTPASRGKSGAIAVKNDADTALDGIMSRTRRM